MKRKVCIDGVGYYEKHYLFLVKRVIITAHGREYTTWHIKKRFWA